MFQQMLAPVSPITGLLPDTLAQDRQTDALYVAAQRTVSDLRTLVASNLPADELRLLLVSIANELKAGMMQVDLPDSHQ
jgi:hypothetical protein